MPVRAPALGREGGLRHAWRRELDAAVVDIRQLVLQARVRRGGEPGRAVVAEHGRGVTHRSGVQAALRSVRARRGGVFREFRGGFRQTLRARRALRAERRRRRVTMRRASRERETKKRTP